MQGLLVLSLDAGTIREIECERALGKKNYGKKITPIQPVVRVGLSHEFSLGKGLVATKYMPFCNWMLVI